MIGGPLMLCRSEPSVRMSASGFAFIRMTYP
jgi:hypothetical protein